MIPKMPRDQYHRQSPECHCLVPVRLVHLEVIVAVSVYLMFDLISLIIIVKSTRYETATKRTVSLNENVIYLDEVYPLE